jgi:hypothetical protein
MEATVRKGTLHLIDRQPSAERFSRLLAELEACFTEGERLMGSVRERFGRVDNEMGVQG